MAMEPVGSWPGIGASLQGFISTFGGAVVGALIGRRFNGTTLPLATGAFACGLSSLLFVLLAERWRLFPAASRRARRCSSMAEFNEMLGHLLVSTAIVSVRPNSGRWLHQSGRPITAIRQ